MRGKFKKSISILLVAVILLVLPVPSAMAFPGGGRVGVHDPSIIKDETGKYYVFGSHIAQASSDDLIQWTQEGTAEYEGLIGNASAGINPIYGDIQDNLAEAFTWAGYDDGDASNGNYAVWAPDVAFNQDYVWTDAVGIPTGDVGAYVMYYSASSTWRRSCIGFVISTDVEGPYEKPAYGSNVIVSSGFTNADDPTAVIVDGKGSRDTRYTNAHIGAVVADGQVNGFSDNWILKNGTAYNTSYAPNAIDPALITDANGKLWMVYGSWSGGMFILEIDTKTGRAIYPGDDSVDGYGQTVDRYFGTRVAGQQINDSGNNSQSIEGPYIAYDANAEYYYLFATYGGLAMDGGYNMRQFRSKNVTGPYEDAAGNPALFRKAVGSNGVTASNVNEEVGVRVMSNYQFSDMELGYKSPGHNSVFQDDDGQWYLLYHTRFTQDKWHELRVHQMFMNADGWLVTAPYEYHGDTMNLTYDNGEIVGTYELLIHTKKFGNFIEPTYIVSLLADGSIEGEISGTWEKGKENQLTLHIDGAVYTGVFFEQTDESSDKALRMTFTTVGDNNQSIWGTSIIWSDTEKGQYILERLSLPSTTTDNLILSKEGTGNTAIQWTSSDKTVITDDGIVSRKSDDTVVTMTASVTINETTVSKDFKIKVVGTYGRFKALYHYDFEADAVKGNTISSRGTVATGGNAEMKITGGDTGSVKIVEDEVRGNVLEILNTGTTAKVNYLELPADSFATIKDGYTINMWVNVDKTSQNYFMHSALFEANAGGPNTYKMTRLGANLIGRINANGYADVDPNDPGDNGTDNILPTGEWHMVSYTADTNGLAVYMDGQLLNEQSKDLSGCFGTNSDAINKSSWVAIGAGDIWSDRDISNAKFDDVAIFGHAFTASEMKELYKSFEKDTPKDPEFHEAFLAGFPDGSVGADLGMTRSQVASMLFNLLDDQEVETEKTFSDVTKTAWYYEAVTSLGALGIISGYEDGSFQPDNSITRAEFVSMLCAFADADEALPKGEFADVSETAWYYKAVTTAKSKGWVSGYIDGLFHPEDILTRAQAVVATNAMLARKADQSYIDQNIGELKIFKDLSNKHWAYYSIIEASNPHKFNWDEDKELWLEIG